MYCKNCGRFIPDDSNLCPYCGEAVIRTENQIPAGQEVPEDLQKDKAGMIPDPAETDDNPPSAGIAPESDINNNLNNPFGVYSPEFKQKKLKHDPLIIAGLVVLCIMVIALAASPGNQSTANKSTTNSSSKSSYSQNSTTAGTSGTSGVSSGLSGSTAASGASSDTTQTSDYIAPGMYKIGKDLNAGTYMIVGSGYGQVSSDSSGTLDSIVTNDNFSNSWYVDVSNGQYLEFTAGKGYTIAYAPVPDTTSGVLHEGMFKAGRDFPAGEYKLSSTGAATAYVEVASNARGDLDSIIMNDNFTGDKYVTIKNGQYITLDRCQLILR